VAVDVVKQLESTGSSVGITAPYFVGKICTVHS